MSASPKPYTRTNCTTLPNLCEFSRQTASERLCWAPDAHAEKHNITLQYLYAAVPGIVHLTVLLDFVLSDSLDVAITLVEMTFTHF